MWYAVCHMNQRRSGNASGGPSGRAEADRSVLADVRALAARTRSVTGSAPMQAPSAVELSGVRARRDSVVGARVTPQPIATAAQLPNVFWGVLGCLSTLVVGFAGLWW